MYIPTGISTETMIGRPIDGGDNGLIDGGHRDGKPIALKGWGGIAGGWGIKGVGEV